MWLKDSVIDSCQADNGPCFPRKKGLTRLDGVKVMCEKKRHKNKIRRFILVFGIEYESM